VANIAQRGGWLRWDGNRRCLEIVSGSLFQYDHSQGRIQPVRLGGRAISDIFASQVSSRLRYRFKRDEANFTTLLWQNNGRYNDLTSQMLFSELYKSMVNKVTFVGFRGEIVPSALTPLGPSPDHDKWDLSSALMSVYSRCLNESNVPTIAFTSHLSLVKAMKLQANIFNASVSRFSSLFDVAFCGAIFIV